MNLNNKEKYIQKTPSGKWSVVLPKRLREPEPRRLRGRWSSKEEAINARDEWLKGQGLRLIENEVKSLSTSDKSKTIQGNGSVIVGLFDLHCPYQHDDALSVACQIVKMVQPDDIIYGGDVLDFYMLSRFLKDESRAKSIQEEIDTWVNIAKQVEKQSPDSTFYHLMGNHEQRLLSWLYANPGLLSLNVLKLPSLLKFDELGIEHCQSIEYLGRKLVITHGRYYSSLQGSAVKKECKTRAFQQSCIMGHCHHFGHFELNGPLGRLSGYEIGSLCIDSWYDQDERFWQRGLVVVTIDNGNFDVELVRIENNQAIFRGNVVKA